MIKTVDAYYDGKIHEWVPVGEGKVVGVVRRFFMVNSEKSLDEACDIAHYSPNVKFNFKFTNGFRPTLDHASMLISRVPNLGILACSGYTFLKRLRISLSSIFQVLTMPIGSLMKWRPFVLRVVAERLRVGDSLGTICRMLNLFGIKISVKGFLKFRWRQVRPFI